MREFRRPAGDAAGAGDGHSHGKRDGPKMEGMGMKGMDEMGIFTTNIAINNQAANKVQGPGDKKPNGLPTSGGSPAPAVVAGSGAAPAPMAGMPGMPTKRRSKLYGIVERPVEIWPVVISV